MIITNDIKLLVKKIEDTGNLQSHFPTLLQLLSQSCKNQALANSLNTPTFLPDILNFDSFSYPIENGYAVAFDVLDQESQLLYCWHKYGFVVGKSVVNVHDCEKAIHTILSLCDQVDMDLNNEATWKKDSNGIPLLSRGFFELYHDDCLAQIRQSLRLYLHHVVLWGSPFLWTSFDRLGIKLPQGIESQGLPLHVDQNPLVHAGFQTMQGVVALEDCPIEVGTFVAVPRSYQYFQEYANFIDPHYKGEYIELPCDSELCNTLNALKVQAIPMKRGDIVSWDSRTTHANSTNVSSKNRYVAYVSTGLAKDDTNLSGIRKKYFESAEGFNVRDAYLHASKKPRFTDLPLLSNMRNKEQLNSLGLCLYGLHEYKDYL